MRAKPIYSVRDALGRELWWTTARKSALELAHDFNVAGVGAVLYKRATGSVYAARALVYSDTLETAHESGQGRGLSAHQLPVAVWKCSQVEPRKPHGTTNA